MAQKAGVLRRGTRITTFCGILYTEIIGATRSIIIREEDGGVRCMCIIVVLNNNINKYHDHISLLVLTNMCL